MAHSYTGMVPSAHSATGGLLVAIRTRDPQITKLWLYCGVGDGTVEDVQVSLLRGEPIDFRLQHGDATRSYVYRCPHSASGEPKR